MVARPMLPPPGPLLELCAVWGLFFVVATGCGAAEGPRRFSDAHAVAAQSYGPPSRADSDPVRPGWLGVELQASPEGVIGVAVVNVVRRSPAAEAGLAVGDLVVQVDGTAMSDPMAMVRRIRSTVPGKEVSLGVKRNGLLRQVAVRAESSPSPDELLQRRFVGLAAPPLDGLRLVSGDVAPTWEALRGELVVLEFWSPWCGVCRLMHHRLNEWHTQWAMYGVKILGITALAPDAASEFATRSGMGYAVLVDPDEAVFRAYDVFAVPSLFLVDRRGKVVDASTGYSSQRLAHMEKQLASLVSEGQSP